MNSVPREILPQRIKDPTSPEDIGWNSCCQQMEESFLRYQIRQIFESRDTETEYSSSGSHA